MEYLPLTSAQIVSVLGEGIDSWLVLDFSKDTNEPVGVGLWFAFACRQRERFQLENR